MADDQAVGAPGDDKGFVEAVMRGMSARKVKPRCLVCAVIGWDQFNLIPMPIVMPALAAGEGMQTAAFVCLECGHITFHNLEVLGVGVQLEVSTGLFGPDGQPAQPGSSLVLP